MEHSPQHIVSPAAGASLLPQLHSAWELAKSRGDSRCQADCCRDLAAALRQVGDAVGAVQYLQLAASAEMASWRPAECSLSPDQLLHFSTTAALQGDCERAFALTRAASTLPTARPQEVHRQLAALEIRFGLLHAARNELLAAFQSAVDSQDLGETAEILEALGHLERAADRPGDAQQFFRDSADRFTEVGDDASAERAKGWLCEASQITRLMLENPELN
jgi:hypothetical protein